VEVAREVVRAALVPHLEIWKGDASGRHLARRKPSHVMPEDSGETGNGQHAPFPHAGGHRPSIFQAPAHDRGVNIERPSLWHLRLLDDGIERDSLKVWRLPGGLRSANLRCYAFTIRQGCSVSSGLRWRHKAAKPSS